MNPAETFVPPWAESALAKPPVEELKLLREFYAAWVHYHTIPKDGMAKERQKLAGKKLIALHEELEAVLANRQ